MSYQGHTPARWPIPRSAWSFAPDRVREHPDFAIGAYVSEPFLGQAPTSDAESQHLLQAMLQQRGYTAIPSRDLREYVKQQIVTAGVGFVVGVSVGALLGTASLTFLRSLGGR